jgi:adenine-specific DNA-methyltransferase
MCSAFRGKPDRYPNLTIKKIPKAVLNRCEWGKDDYSLQVENLPKAPPPKGQMELIPADGDQTKVSQTTNGSDARPEVR